MALSEKAVEARRRLYYEFPTYAASVLKIRTKDAEIQPLILNPAQKVLVDAVEKQWRETGRVRIVVLKGRQQGMSTCIAAWLYWRVSQNKAQRCLQLAHKADATSNLFELSKRYHDLLPDFLRPTTKYSSKKELNFSTLQSSYTVATAGGDGVGRSDTITLLHASEVAFWPKSTQQDLWNGLFQSVPRAKGTAVFVESTANGCSGVYYDLWQSAVRGESEFLPVFVPWFLSPEYAEEAPDGFNRTPDEADLVAKYGLTDAQLYWRRLKIGATSREQFQQEYPCNPDEAFLSTGMPVFNPEQVSDMLRSAPLPKKLYALEGDTWVENGRGNLVEWIEHDPQEYYTIGADVAMGIKGGDWSVAQVLDSRKRQVARYREHVHPDFFATVLFELGKRYNYAHLVIENNNHGLLSNTRLIKDLGYPNAYIEQSVDKLTDKFGEKLGFTVNAATKPLIIDELRAALRKEEMSLFDRQTLEEMRTFIVTPEGRMEAEEGKFDDCIMALALANHIHEGRFDPVVVTDDFYIQVP